MTGRHELVADMQSDLSNLPARGVHTLVVEDSTEVLLSLVGKVDAIITDPPYEFNTSGLATGELQRLYSKFVRGAIGALKPGGQLLVSVPSYARNGKQVPYFQTQGALVRQIVQAAEAANRDLINIVRTVPAKKAVFPSFLLAFPLRALAQNYMVYYRGGEILIRETSMTRRSRTSVRSNVCVVGDDDHSNWPLRRIHFDRDNTPQQLQAMS